MGIAVATEFKRVYAEWAYRKGMGEDASAYAEAVACLWEAMDPFTREAVKAEILSVPQVVQTQFVVGPTRTWPMMIIVMTWALPTVTPTHSGYPAWEEDFDPTWSLPDAG